MKYYVDSQLQTASSLYHTGKAGQTTRVSSN